MKTETDIESYVYAYNNYIRMLCDMRRYDRALREANTADKRLRSIGYTTFTDHHDIAQIMGESLLYMDQEDSAAISFQKSVKGIHTRLVNHHDPLDLRECQKTMNAIAKAYLHKGQYDKVEPWLRIPRKFTHPLAYSHRAVPTDKASVVLSVKANKDVLIFTVEDTGIGVPPDQAENIFAEFVQLDEYTHGTGIGLPIARVLAQKMGGNVTLDTTYTAGARFVMSLPL